MGQRVGLLGVGVFQRSALLVVHPLPYCFFLEVIVLTVRVDLSKMLPVLARDRVFRWPKTQILELRREVQQTMHIAWLL